MSGPGGPGGPRGPRGPMPGGMFGPGGGIFGPGGRAWGPGFKFPGPIPPAPGGNVYSDGESWASKRANDSVNWYCNSKIVVKNTKSKVKGFISAFRLHTTGSLHYNLFMTKVAAATQDFTERRITDEQCKYRKLKAADKYYSYLYKVGLYTRERYKYEMRNFAKNSSVKENESYIIEQVFEESSISRSR